MQRRQLLVSLAIATAGCTASSSSGDGMQITDWIDDVADSGVVFSAAYLESDVETFVGHFRGRFDDGSIENADHPGDAHHYGAVGDDLLDVDDTSGWLVFHPDERAQLLEVEHRDRPLSWQRD